MKRKLWYWIVLIAAMTAALPTYAQSTQRQTRGARDDNERIVQPQQVDPAPRETMPPHHEFPQRGRMSPEERRQLRRDIDDAGRELYRRNPPRPSP